MSVKPIKAVIDTQLFLRAAINRKSLPARIIFDLRQSYQLVTSEAIVLEIRDVLNRAELRAKFLSLTDTVVNEIMQLLTDAELVVPTEIEAISRDPKDDIFLACAKVAKAQYIVSEDKDLLVLNPYDGIKIVNAFDFLGALQGSSD